MKVCKGTLTLYFDKDFVFLCTSCKMDVLIGKEQCNRCDVLKNVLDEKGIHYHKQKICVYYMC
jgi:hypothetical protein